MTHRDPFQPLPFRDSVILSISRADMCAASGFDSYSFSTLASHLTSAEENFSNIQLLLALEPAGHRLPFRRLPGRGIHLSPVQGQPPSPAVSPCSFIKFYI